jgi:hypothetical protein
MDAGCVISCVCLHVERTPVGCDVGVVGRCQCAWGVASDGACGRCDVGVWLACGHVVSLGYNKLGAKGGLAIAASLQHLTSLVTLEYVSVSRMQSWVRMRSQLCEW